MAQGVVDSTPSVHLRPFEIFVSFGRIQRRQLDAQITTLTCGGGGVACLDLGLNSQSCCHPSLLTCSQRCQIDTAKVEVGEGSQKNPTTTGRAPA
ncbi:hypothetical protein PC119_g14381 [Phytophthora cactorum]|nr:hypothetical protein PC114_g14608 [Phytophthora cactorum]KAG3007237.1 hypothetical protein PC120_g16935 [Phytophthora cactorum]KAG3007963.1 hypothetical protein PC119_g14381 [Phytophthora cactorum]